MSQTTLFDRRTTLRRLLDEADLAAAESQRLARAIADADDLAGRRALLLLLGAALDAEQAAEDALPAVLRTDAPEVAPPAPDAVAQRPDALPSKQGGRSSRAGSFVKSALPPAQTTPEARQASAAGYDGKPCPKCGAYKVVSSAGAWVCEGCGFDSRKEARTLDPGFRICEFCGCNTNARLRARCRAGREADSAPKQEASADAAAMGRRAEEAQDELRRLEDAKRVGPEVMAMTVGPFAPAPSAAAPSPVTPTPAPTSAGESTASDEGASEEADPTSVSIAASPTATRSAAPCQPTTEYGGPPPSWWVGDEIDPALGAEVLAAGCLSLLMNAKPGKPATITPVAVGGTLYAAFMGTSQWAWRTATLRLLCPRKDWQGDEPHAEGRPGDDGYGGRLVKIRRKGEWVISGSRLVARQVCWLDPDAPRPPACWTPQGAEQKERLLAASEGGELFPRETPTAAGGGL